MKKNMGTADRIIRTMLAIAVAVLYYLGIISGTTLAVLAILAVIFLLTSLLGYCPLYSLFGIQTCSKSSGTIK